MGTLRIISGQWKRRLLNGPKGQDTTRPLPDRIRESLFTMLQGHLEDQPIFDAFAGVGTFGIEAASRGASQVVMVERDRVTGQILEDNIDALPGCRDICEVVHGDALGIAALERCPRPVHIIFFDPPYPMVHDHASRARIFNQFRALAQFLDDDGYAILRTPWPLFEEGDDDKKHPLSMEMQGLKGPETHEYSSMAVHWYMKDGSAQGDPA